MTTLCQWQSKPDTRHINMSSQRNSLISFAIISFFAIHTTGQHLYTRPSLPTSQAVQNNYASSYQQLRQQQQQQQQQQQPRTSSPYALQMPPPSPPLPPSSPSPLDGGNGQMNQNWARGPFLPPIELPQGFGDVGARELRSSQQQQDSNSQISRRQQIPQALVPKAARHIAGAQHLSRSTAGNSTAPNGLGSQLSGSSSADLCADKLCYGLPMGCASSQMLAGASVNNDQLSNQRQQVSDNGGGESCTVLMTSKRFVNPSKPAARDIFFELIAIAAPDRSNYAAVGFSENGRMQGFVSECLQYRDSSAPVQIVQLKHSYNLPGYMNVPVNILSGIKSFGVSYVNGHYQCRWSVESAVEFSFEAPNGSVIIKREDLGYKNYHILLASGDYDEVKDLKSMHSTRISSLSSVSLAQTGQVKSLGSHILIRIHGSLMVCIWIGLVSLSIITARYYKNEWNSSRINDLAIWFVIHRSLMLLAWFGSMIAVIFAYMYTETYHLGLHQLSGSACLFLSTLQVAGGLCRPSLESSKRVYFNWAHFTIGNLSFLFAMLALFTAAFLTPAHLPAIYSWVVVAFIVVYIIFNLLMTGHQYIMHKSSKISITPMSELNSSTSNSRSTDCNSTSFVVSEFVGKEKNSAFRQFFYGILITVILSFSIILLMLVNFKSS